MMRLSAVSFLAVGHNFFLASLIALSPLAVHAADTTSTPNNQGLQGAVLQNNNLDGILNDDKKFEKLQKLFGTNCPAGQKPGKNGECGEDCSDDAKTVADAETDMTQKCSEAGLGGNCITMVQKCMSSEELAPSDKSWVNQLMPMAGQLTGGNNMLGALTGALGNTSQKAPRGCGNMPAKDYFDEKSKLEREIREAQNELTDLDKDINDEQKSVNDKMKDAQKDANEAQKNFNEKKLDVSKEKRDAAKDLQDKQNDQAKNLMEMNSKLMQKRSDMSAQERSFTQQMLQMTENSGKLDCLVKVKKLRDEVNKAGIFSGNGGMAGIAQGNSQSQTLKGAWDECMATFYAKREELTQQRIQYMQSAQNELANIQASIDEGNQAMTSYLQQHQEMMTDLNQKVTDAQTDAMNQVKTAQQSVQLAQQTMMQKQQALKNKQNQITMRISSLNQDINRLGPVPQPGAKSGWTDAQDKVVNYLNKASQFKKDHCEGKQTQCTDSKSRGLCSRLGESKSLEKDKKALDKAQQLQDEKRQKRLENSLGEQ